MGAAIFWRFSQQKAACTLRQHRNHAARHIVRIHHRQNQTANYDARLSRATFTENGRHPALRARRVKHGARRTQCGTVEQKFGARQPDGNVAQYWFFVSR